ncbi:hypothetical protein A2276_07800 [candidate division WOR-1 bacterium RIFOXYA12_FULL_43_27]|uniref:DUF5723 domain-containing protein n=1 Tax=candidate division WOR-1 bacterium RIFOXYC2_FULL_46_14 TaxID=1802587 RepID=A0A1F4U5U6_UNCSA|nr:MAG: hypothetical protein A2276_07800 [candidate division WOR-1 bacterium RIFOXYA12_FULL_43_27]OGC20501.1 MAG: hypothetical protein A2292_05625 [candidate division WOR-1 bacterium RIFOXYB2_FULL_46_45]OGC31762.1 MAG: hypothetical protein A2232_05825 [candidate division WOR-1 bacterium RIFOXYA2_FULL_46_56]OGC40345.1 MAG: hypothetical protein A2438_03645 [candidate division WOR-1 bacterium RIFOXYC2_FULL_46_14]
MKNKLFARVIVFFLLLSFQSAYAFYTARPLAMGGAFTAVADDANAVYYNPAGFARNPGIDILGSTVLANRNNEIGDNQASLKVCFEAEMNPFAWVLGIGAATAMALEGAKYLHDQGVVDKGWGQPNTYKPGESMSEDVKKQGSEKKVDVHQQAKEKAKEVGKDAAGKAAEFGKQSLEAAKAGFLWSLKNPWFYYGGPYHSYYYDRGYSPQGKAQFALGLSWMFDKNPALNQNTNWYTLTLASGYEERIAFGGNINVYDLLIPSTNLKGLGGGFDVGMLLRPLDQISFGLSVANLLVAPIRFDNGSVTNYEMDIKGGISIAPIQNVMLAVDVHNFMKKTATMHYGVELFPIPGVALRAGLNDNSKSAGIGIALNQLILDYAYLGGSYNRTQVVGVTWKI